MLRLIANNSIFTSRQHKRTNLNREIHGADGYDEQSKIRQPITHDHNAADQTSALQDVRINIYDCAGLFIANKNDEDELMKY
jgi:hypothetical protein